MNLISFMLHVGNESSGYFDMSWFLLFLAIPDDRESRKVLPEIYAHRFLYAVFLNRSLCAYRLNLQIPVLSLRRLGSVLLITQSFVPGLDAIPLRSSTRCCR